MIGDLLDTTKLDITIIAAIAGYTALRLSISVDRGYIRKPAVFIHKETLLTGFAYLGIVFLCTSILTSLIVNPWWSVIFVLFFAAVLSEFVILSLLRQFTVIFSTVAMMASVYLYIQFII